MRKQIRKSALTAATVLTITATIAGGLFCTSAEPLEAEPESIAVDYLDPDEWVARATEELEAAKTAEEEAYNNLDSMIKQLQEDAEAAMEEAAAAVEDADTALGEAFDAMCTDGLATDESEPESEAAITEEPEEADPLIVEAQQALNEAETNLAAAQLEAKFTKIVVEQEEKKLSEAEAAYLAAQEELSALVSPEPPEPPQTEEGDPENADVWADYEAALAEYETALIEYNASYSLKENHLIDLKESRDAAEESKNAAQEKADAAEEALAAAQTAKEEAAAAMEALDPDAYTAYEPKDPSEDPQPPTAEQKAAQAAFEAALNDLKAAEERYQSAQEWYRSVLQFDTEFAISHPDPSSYFGEGHQDLVDAVKAYKDAKALREEAEEELVIANGAKIGVPRCDGVEEEPAVPVETAPAEYVPAAAPAATYLTDYVETYTRYFDILRNYAAGYVTKEQLRSWMLEEYEQVHAFVPAEYVILF